ncbi:virulence protein RhuM/Fic/DOC family protein [Bifidobacterium imperatoris]|uniref:Death-on-curing family protein n=1 Tax=Bifidobacterium imperatoris TaxID=2020965 RepID=A0A2N5IT82_9BIFI|nr:virulence protein RhuM/Fic/DOC family protein [Bifidobacterium imperatoris]PLS25172.1 death-on-curing family protein [Bifidobacterium imperatoris]QSY57714.1 virulence protein RhuM/Fic/DOC family protein [Bifidobacterium imperatoris]
MVKDIELYRAEDGSVQLEVSVHGDTVWLTLDQMAELFDRNKSTISRHIKNVFSERELERSAVVAKNATTAADGKKYMVEYYNLDVIISIGYRVKSQRGVQFRRWATNVLRQYLIDGYAANEQRLQQLEKVVTVLARSNDQLAAGIADVVSSYLPGLDILRDYDANELSPNPIVKPVWTITATAARTMAARLRKEYPDDTLLGQERGDALERIIGAIYQSFAGQDLYPTVEEKAAHLLYFVVKDHPFADGNKRMAAAMFVSFLEGNADAFAQIGKPIITNNDLAAITLLIAVSDPSEKDLMIDLVERMLSPQNRR